MRFIHTSDIHIASPMTTRLTAVRAKERNREIISTFRKITEDATLYGAEAIVIAGDLFDNERIGIRSLQNIVDLIKDASAVTFFYLPGNHEKNRLLASGVSIPENLKIFEEEWTYFDLSGVRFAGRSTTSSDMFSTLSLPEDGKNVVVLHGELTDRSADGGYIGVKEMASLPIDYLALGHYHSYRDVNISERTTAVYSGTPEGRGFDETGDKGYVDVSILGSVSYKFVKRSKRALHIVDVDLSDAESEMDIENKVRDALTRHSGDDLIRILLTGEHSPTLRRDTDALVERFKPYFYYFEVKDITKLRISPDDYKNDKSLKGEFIRLVLESKDFTAEEKERIIECGVRALMGEEI